MKIIDRVIKNASEDMDCLVWNRSTCNGHPALRVNGKTMLVRRVLWEELNGEIPAGKIIRATCGDIRCVNPEHLSMTTYQKLAKELGAIGVMSGKVRSAAIAKAKQAKALAINYEIVQIIRTSDASGVSLSQQYGISQNLVSRVRTHKCWKDWTNNPFAGLGATA